MKSVAPTWVQIYLALTVYSVVIHSLEMVNLLWQPLLLSLETASAKGLAGTSVLDRTGCRRGVVGHRSQPVDGVDNKVLFQGEVCLPDAF